MALNILSTGVMVRLGKVYGNRMVDVAVTNSKLEDRALRILSDLTGIDRELAAERLTAAGGSVKLALLMQASGLEAAAAREALAAYGPGLRDTLAALGYALASGSSPSHGPQ
jgi:N-acetylmuramic acid 6-phosphate etherase